jgi:hypothetical protein
MPTTPGDLGGRHPQAPQGLDRLEPVGGETGRPPPRCRGAVEQARLALRPPLGEPLPHRALAGPGGLVPRDQAQPSSSIRLTNSLRLFEQVRALARGFIRILLVWVASAPPGFKEVRMNNMVRNYT